MNRTRNEPLFTPNQSKLYSHLVANNGMELFWRVFMTTNDSRGWGKELSLKVFVANALVYEIDQSHKQVASLRYSPKANYFCYSGVVLVMMPNKTFEFVSTGRLSGRILPRATPTKAKVQRGHSFHAALKHQDSRRVRYHG